MELTVFFPNSHLSHIYIFTHIYKKYEDRNFAPRGNMFDLQWKSHHIWGHVHIKFGAYRPKNKNSIPAFLLFCTMVAYSLHILLFTYRVVYIAAFQLLRQEILSIYALTPVLCMMWTESSSTCTVLQLPKHVCCRFNTYTSVNKSSKMHPNQHYQEPIATKLTNILYYWTVIEMYAKY